MSLEASIQELNTNIVALISALTTPDRLAVAATAPAKPKAPKPAPAAASVAATSPTPTAAPTPQPAADLKPEPATPASPVKDVATIEQARPLAIELGQKKGREALTSLLTKFGASKLPELPPHQYAAFISDAKAALAA